MHRARSCMSGWLSTSPLGDSIISRAANSGPQERISTYCHHGHQTLFRPDEGAPCPAWRPCAPLGGRALHGAVRSTHACSLTARLWFHKAAGDSSSLARPPGGALVLGVPLGIVIFVRPHRPGGEEDEDQKEKPAHHSASTCVRVDEGGAAGRTRGGAPWFQAGV